MPDEAAAVAAVEEKPAAVATEAAVSVSEAKPSGLGTEAGKEPAATDAPLPKSWYADDWREKIAGGDDKKMQRLARYASLENYVNRTNKLEGDLHAGRLRPLLGDAATEGEVAEYRKAWGIPAEATAETYGVKWPDGYKPSEADTADMGEFLKQMHSAHETPATVQRVWQSYVGLQAKAAEQLQMAAQQKTEEYKAEVRGKYMGENGRFDRLRFERDARLGNQFLAENVGEDRAQEVTSLTLDDGTKLGDHPLFWDLFVGAALKSADDMSLVTAESSIAGGGSLDEQFQKALALGDTDTKAYHSKEHQDKLLRLGAAIAQRDSKKAA